MPNTDISALRHIYAAIEISDQAERFAISNGQNPRISARILLRNPPRLIA
jgi:hypothetical protein